MRWILIAGMSVCLFGQTAAAQPAAQDEAEADHEALRELKAVFEKAASENNLDLLKPYISENFSAVTYTDREFTDFEAFKARWQKTRDEIVGHGSYKQRRQERGSLSIASGHFGLDAIARCGACRRTA
jgi:hypothetical protein